jgi:hypothetical protein
MTKAFSTHINASREAIRRQVEKYEDIKGRKTARETLNLVGVVLARKSTRSGHGSRESKIYQGIFFVHVSYIIFKLTTDASNMIDISTASNFYPIKESNRYS